MNTIDLERVAADWAARGYSCDLWIDPPGQHWEDFLHEVDEVVLVVEGEMEFEIAGALYHPDVGEEIFIPAGAVHSTRNLGATIASWLYGYKFDGGRESVH
jgi:mannose-6-phosphate isomerase-like protein (cupin superfamily)